MRARFLVGRLERGSAEVGIDSGPSADMAGGWCDAGLFVCLYKRRLLCDAGFFATATRCDQGERGWAERRAGFPLKLNGMENVQPEQ